ncbi:MAG: recombinase family protein [Candidatus Saccharimonadales bacterium]
MRTFQSRYPPLTAVWKALLNGGYLLKPDFAKPKCFVYLRRSQDREDRQAYSLEKQDQQVRQIITDNNYTSVHLPPEERSARHLGRPIFNDMVERIEKGEARYIAVWQLSRLSRNPIDAGRVIYLLDQGSLLAIHTPTRTYHNTPDDKAFLAIELAFAKKNNDDLSVQVKESFVQKRNHGEYPGPAPLGYLNAIISPGHRNIVPHPEISPKIIQLFNKAASECYTLHDIWLETEKLGLRSKNNLPLAKQTVVGILKNRVYTGVFRYGSPEYHQGTYKPLISSELYDKVQLMMGWARKRNVPHTTAGRFYPFKGLVLCGTCSFNITAYTKPKTLSNGTKAYYEFYTCTKKSKAIKCLEPQISAKELEGAIKTEMSDYEISKADGIVCSQWLDNHFESYMKSQNRYREIWHKDNLEAKKALDTLDTKLETGVMSDERYQSRSKRHEEVLARTTKLLETSNQEAERWLELAKETFSSVVNIGEVFDEAQDDERRELMKYLGLNWTLSNKKVALTPREPLNLLHVSNRNQSWRARPDLNRRSPP